MKAWLRGRACGPYAEGACALWRFQAGIRTDALIIADDHAPVLLALAEPSVGTRGHQSGRRVLEVARKRSEGQRVSTAALRSRCRVRSRSSCDRASRIRTSQAQWMLNARGFASAFIIHTERTVTQARRMTRATTRASRSHDCLPGRLKVSALWTHMRQWAPLASVPTQKFAGYCLVVPASLRKLRIDPMPQDIVGRRYSTFSTN